MYNNTPETQRAWQNFLDDNIYYMDRRFLLFMLHESPNKEIEKYIKQIDDDYRERHKNNIVVNRLPESTWTLKGQPDEYTQ